jgi:carboxylesterase
MIVRPELHGEAFTWPGGSTGVLLVHGFTATVAEVRALASRLHGLGYTVSAPLLPGHYTHPADLNKVRWQDWVETVEQAYAGLTSRCQTVIVGGESTGGLLSLYLAQRHPEIAALLLYAVALRLAMRPIDAVRLRLAAPFIPWLPKPNMDDHTPWQGYPVNPLKGVLQLLALQKVVRPNLKQVTQPALIVQGRLDRTVQASVPEMIASGIRSKIIETHWLENSAHCVLLDYEAAAVEQMTIDFLAHLNLTPEIAHHAI